MADPRRAPRLQYELVTAGDLRRRQHFGLAASACISGSVGLTRLCVWGPGSTCRVIVSPSTSPASTGLVWKERKFVCLQHAHLCTPTWSFQQVLVNKCPLGTGGGTAGGKGQEGSLQRTLPHAVPASLRSQRAQGSGWRPGTPSCPEVSQALIMCSCMRPGRKIDCK